MKYKIGDRVRIISNLPEDKKNHNSLFSDYLNKRLGTIMTISQVEIDRYKLKEDDLNCYWSEDMFEGLAEFTKSDLKDNHIVKIKIGNYYVLKNLTDMKGINDDLTFQDRSYSDLDIMEVYEFETLVWKREEKPVEILDEVEKKWLKNFIKSTNIEFVEITKGSNSAYMKEFLVMSYEILGTSGITHFPYFEANAMYKGMELNKRYTLKELGLE